MWESVWGGYQPQTWCNGIISTPQVTQKSKSEANFVGIMIQGCIHMTLRQQPMPQTLCISLLWMYQAIWGGYQPQPSCFSIISTPQVNLTFQIWGQLVRCNGIRVQPYALEATYEWLKQFIYVQYGCMQQSEVDISLKHNVVVSFSLLKWTWIPKSGGNLAGVTV